MAIGNVGVGYEGVNAMTYLELARSINNGKYDNSDYSDCFTSCTEVMTDEVNAWTYWQGIGVEHPKILLLGQDWGSIDHGAPFIKAIQEINKSKTQDKVNYFDYVDKKHEFVSDNNLIEFFKILGYPDIKKIHYDDLFFTNLIPGFRASFKSTGGFCSAWITQKVKEDLKCLVSILKPQIIICLGKDVYIHTLSIYGIDVRTDVSKWNNYLETLNKPNMVDDDKIAVFPVAHPGYFGQMNRKGAGDPRKDWERIKVYMTEG